MRLLSLYHYSFTVHHALLALTSRFASSSARRVKGRPDLVRPSDSQIQATITSGRSMTLSPPGDLSSTSASDWTLVAEGGANLVVRYTGDSQAWRRKVLRLRKRSLDASAPRHASVDEEDPAVAFVERVVDAVLLPDGLTAPLRTLKAPEDFVAALSERIEPLRSAKRRQIDELDTRRRLVVVTEDLTGPFSDLYPSTSTVITIEIKVRSLRSSCSGDS